MRQLAIGRCLELDRLLFGGGPDIDAPVSLEAVPLERVQPAALQAALLRFLLAYAKQTGRPHICRRLLVGNLLLATLDRKFDLHLHLDLEVSHLAIAIDQVSKLSAQSIRNHTASIAVQTDDACLAPRPKRSPARPAPSPRSHSSKRSSLPRTSRNSDIKYFSRDRSTQSRSRCRSSSRRKPLEVQVDVSDFQASFTLQHIEIPAFQPLCVDRRLIV